MATWALVVSSVASLCSLLATITFAYRLRAVAQGESRTQAAVAQLAATVDGASQAWFWTPEWQQGEIEADEDIAANRLTTVDSTDEMFDVLDKSAEKYAPTSG